jgi:Holliday junction resolvase
LGCPILQRERNHTMTQRESRLSQKIQKALRERGVFCFKVHGNPNMMAGLPDIIACVEGLFVGFEVKHPGTRENVSPRQQFVHDQIRNSKGRAYVVCSVDETMALVDVIRAAALGN